MSEFTRLRSARCRQTPEADAGTAEVGPAPEARLIGSGQGTARRGFIGLALGAVGGVAAALLARPNDRPTAEAGHGVANFPSGSAAPAIHASNTDSGYAIVGTNNSSAENAPLGANAVRAERLGTGDGTALDAERSGGGSGPAIFAHAFGNANVDALSALREGSHDGSAVTALREDNGLGHGVYGRRFSDNLDGDGHGVFGERRINGAGHGVLGLREGADGDGVRGVRGSLATQGGTAGNGAGVQGFSKVGPSDAPDGTGVRGVGAATGVLAEGPVGLSVIGKSKFSTVGSGTIAANSNSAVVPSSQVTASSHISVTLTSNPGDAVSVTWVQRNAGVNFIVHIGRAGPPAPAVDFTYFIVEPGP